MESRQSIGSAVSETAASAVSILGGQASATLVAGIASILLARILGPEGYGKYALATTVASLLSIFTDFGVSAAVAREASRRGREGVAGLVGLALAFTLASALVSTALGALLSERLTLLLLNRAEMVQLTLLALPTVFLNSALNFSYFALLGLGDTASLAALPVIRDLSRSVLSLALAAAYGVPGAVAGLVAGYALAAASGLAALYRRLGRLPLAPAGELKPLLGYGLPLYASSVLGTLSGIYQNSVAAWFATDVEVGNFKVAMNFAALIQLLVAPISLSLLPAFSRLSGDDSGRFFRYAARYTGLILVPAGVYAAVESRDLVALVYGREYALAPGYLSLYSASLLLSGLGTAALPSFFQGVGDTRANLEASLAGLAVLLPLAAPLTQRLGLYGLVASLVASSASSAAYGVWRARRVGAEVDFLHATRTCAAALAALAPLAPLALLNVHPALRVAATATAYALAYGALAPLFGCIDGGDIEVLGQALRGTPLKPLASLVLRYEAVFLRAARNLSGK
ncbi:oligosaccharide flippase family protein [Thermofilum pendens]|uniref:Polysaccharide biosynthesis protein n=1 Tax=Thermofilum pendens (strain DSM 2475 / Hrk 5) TaxID=368408 RepID=A1S103_THEPD|nr:oligosaccharide flippase family protein [Thermofilum pendens]ABL79133.1 polysaccharide biosynthesis protein [Thermofilum pendens Hrk 5]